MTPWLAGVAFLWLVWAPPAAADEPPLEGAAVTHLEQARLFHRRGWADDAWAELMLALATPSGRTSYTAHRLAETWGWQRRDLRAAWAMADRAFALAPDSRARAQAAAVLEMYEQSIGFVVVDGPYDGMTTELELSAAALPFDPRHRALVADTIDGLRAKRLLPVEVGLPVGSYVINGQSVEVSAGGEHRVELPIADVGNRGTRRLQIGRVEAASGVGVYSGDASEALGPLVAFQGTFVVPLGPILVGPTGELARSSWTPPQGSTRHDPMSWAAGAHAGWEPTTDLPVVFRLSGLLRVGTIPGIRLTCEGTTNLTCRVDGGGDTTVHATMLALLPGAEFRLDLRESGRDNALGAGLRFSWERAIGRVDADGRATLPDGGSVAWQAQGRPVRLHGFRLLAGLSLAL